MKWEHRCDFDWLQARQQFVTASDILELIPVTKTGRKREVGKENYLKVIARKTVKLVPDDCISTGAMARGHILEPYAIEEFNRITGEKLFHWDDCIIKSKTRKLAFSPDALSFEQPSGIILAGSGFDFGKSLGEVKSYNGERHLLCANTDKMDLEERWQISVAMAVDNKIEEAFLIFYNPSMTRSGLAVKHYLREDLENEIDTVLDTYDRYVDFLYGLGVRPDVYDELDRNESDIIEEIERMNKLNP